VEFWLRLSLNVGCGPTWMMTQYFLLSVNRLLMRG